MSNIVINDVAQRIQYTATSGQTIFAVPFPFFDNSEVIVYQNGSVINEGGGAGEYGLTGAGSPSGGTLTLVTGATLNDIITIVGDLPVDRTSIYSATISNLTGSDLNADFNREVVMMAQMETTQDYLQLQYPPWAEVSQSLAVTLDRYLPVLSAYGMWGKNSGNTAIVEYTGPLSTRIADADATYLIQTADAQLANAQVMGDLNTGFVQNTTTTGVQQTRTLLGTTNEIDVANGNGAGGDPVFSISNGYIGQTSITTLGTITTGTWNAVTIEENYGGTGQTTYTKGDILYSSSADELTKLPGNTTTQKRFLSQTGDGIDSAAPVWEYVPGGSVIGADLTKADDTNVTLTLGGTPTGSLLSAVSLTLGWSGQLAPGRGGTGASDVPANGELLIGNGTNYTVSTLTAGAGITITEGAGSITIETTEAVAASTPDFLLMGG